MRQLLAHKVLLPLALSAAGVGLEMLLHPYVRQAVFIPSLAVVVASTFYGGLTAGLVATGFSILFIDFFLIEPLYALGSMVVEDATRVLVFTLTAILVSALSRERLARARAEARTQAREELYREVVHELRAPVSAIVGWAGLLHGDLAPADRQRACEVIERNARLQLMLVSDLMDVARIETGKVQLEPVPIDLRAVIDTAIGTVGPSAQHKGVRIEVRTPPQQGQAIVQGDDRRLVQVLWNLLANAIKFTPQGGQVLVQLEWDEECARIEVSDTGVGIDAGRLRSIFEKWEQGAGSAGGMGLGLWVARRLVELHGGTIEAASAPAGGARFSVQLPLAVPAESAC